MITSWLVDVDPTTVVCNDYKELNQSGLHDLMWAISIIEQLRFDTSYADAVAH